MGTNFYIRTNDKRIKDYTTNYSLYDEPEFGYIVHICKLSYGWCPLFQTHRNIRCFNDIDTVVTVCSHANIVDESGSVYTMSEFTELIRKHVECIDCQKYYKLARNQDVKTMIPMYSLIECDREESDISIPFHHDIYAALTDKYYGTHNNALYTRDKFCEYIDWSVDVCDFS